MPPVPHTKTAEGHEALRSLNAKLDKQVTLCALHS